MTSIELLTYISFGYSFIVAMISFVRADYLWKKNFFNKCLIAAICSGIIGLVLELTEVLNLDTGLTIVVMFNPLIYLGYFRLFRWLFKKRTGTEPYITSVSSTVGGIPLDMFSSAYKDGKIRKYQKDRKIMASDFLFSFLQALVPIFTIMALLFLTIKPNK